MRDFGEIPMPFGAKHGGFSVAGERNLARTTSINGITTTSIYGTTFDLIA